jgi:hypothetical protein
MCLKMTLRYSLVVILISTGFSVVRANDTTISCNAPPDKGASVAVHSGNQVSKTQDRQNGTCVFSINGAVATSPPAEQVLNALNQFRDVRPPDPQQAAVAIAALAAASAPVNEVPRELIIPLKEAEAPLAACINAFYSRAGSLALQTSRDSAVSCQIQSPYREAASKKDLLEKTGVAAGVPTLVVSVNWGAGRFMSTVFLPITMLGIPPLRLPTP